MLITDASETGLGAILAQKDEDNKEVVIAYVSRSLVGAEKNYPITELECLAVFWGIQYFHKFLVRRKFIVITNHAALKSLIKGKVPKGRRARWMMELQQYNFEIVHRSGKENKNADALSRLRFEEKTDLKIIISKEKKSIQLQRQVDETWKNIDFLQKELGSKIKVNGYKEKELNNKI
jgi:hypothetical protein